MMSYGGEEGSGIGQLNGPCYLAVDKDGFIFVADHKNDRIVQLNSSLEFIRDFKPGSVGLDKPMRMHLQEETRRLYISEYDLQNITVLDL